MIKKLDINVKYVIASIFMLIFVINDLVFDFLLNFQLSDYISFIFTLLASIITFIASYKIVKLNVKDKAEKISLYVKSNFNNWQVVFSALDIICGIISIISGLTILSGIFKFVKIIYIPTKCIVVGNKSKTVVKSISKFSLIWTIGRIFRKSEKGENKTMSWIKNNKGTIASCLILSPIGGYAGYKFFTSVLALPLWVNILIAIVIGLIVCVSIFFLGVDTTKTATFRLLAKSIKDETTYNSIVDFANDALEIAEEREEAKKRVLAEQQETKEDTAEDVAQAEAQAQKEARIQQYMDEFRASQGK